MAPRFTAFRVPPRAAPGHGRRRFWHTWPGWARAARRAAAWRRAKTESSGGARTVPT